MKKHIPNIITLCNLMCGVAAVVVATTEIINIEIATVLIFCGAIFDFFDGFTARLLKVSSPIGKELDSLADLVTFGFAPAAIVSGIIQHIIIGEPLTIDQSLNTFSYILIYSPYIIVAFSALRLAKFNIDVRQSHSFIGLPTPANAIFFGSMVFLPNIDEFPPVLIMILAFIFSILLIAEIPMFSLKFQNYSWADNKLRYCFLILAVILLAIMQLQALTFIIAIYIMLSIIDDIVNKKKPVA